MIKLYTKDVCSLLNVYILNLKTRYRIMCVVCHICIKMRISKHKYVYIHMQAYPRDQSFEQSSSSITATLCLIGNCKVLTFFE